MSVRDRGDDADAALSYRAVVDAVAGEDEKVAEGFFDLANAPLVRYDVAPSAVEHTVPSERHDPAGVTQPAGSANESRLLHDGMPEGRLSLQNTSSFIMFPPG